LSSFSKQFFGGFEPFQGFASLSADIRFSPNFHLRDGSMKRLG